MARELPFGRVRSHRVFGHRWLVKTWTGSSRFLATVRSSPHCRSFTRHLLK